MTNDFERLQELREEMLTVFDSAEDELSHAEHARHYAEHVLHHADELAEAADDGFMLVAVDGLLFDDLLVRYVAQGVSQVEAELRRNEADDGGAVC